MSYYPVNKFILFSAVKEATSYESIWDRVGVMGVLSGQMREASQKKKPRPEEGTKVGWESREGSLEAEGMACVRL